MYKEKLSLNSNYREKEYHPTRQDKLLLVLVALLFLITTII